MQCWQASRLPERDVPAVSMRYRNGPARQSPTYIAENSFDLGRLLTSLVGSRAGRRPRHRSPPGASQRRRREDRAHGDATLCEEHVETVYRYALRLAGRTDLAEDLTQETMLRGWRNRQQAARSAGGPRVAAANRDQRVDRPVAAKRSFGRDCWRASRPALADCRSVWPTNARTCDWRWPRWTSCRRGNGRCCTW